MNFTTLIKSWYRFRARLRRVWFLNIRDYTFMINTKTKEVHDLGDPRSLFCLKFINLKNTQFIKANELEDDDNGCAICFPEKDLDIHHKIIKK